MAVIRKDSMAGKKAEYPLKNTMQLLQLSTINKISKLCRFERTDLDEELENQVACLEELVISEEVWVDMGSPDIITVTVEPGNSLNNGD